MKDKIVSIEWDDASSNSGYWDDHRLEDFSLVHNCSVGHLIRRDRKQVVIAMERWRDGDRRYRTTETIPRGMIKKITYL